MGRESRMIVRHRGRHFKCVGWAVATEHQSVSVNCWWAQPTLQSTAMQPHGILETVVYAVDLDAAERFYCDVIGLTVFAKEPGRHLFFRCGNGMFLVFNPEVTSRVEKPVPGGTMVLHGAFGGGHMAFRVREEELEPWRRRLKEKEVGIENEIAWPQGGHSIYFRDPAGNSIELATPKLWGLS